MIYEKPKLTSLLKKLFENKEFELTILDEESPWEADFELHEVGVFYNFKFQFEECCV